MDEEEGKSLEEETTILSDAKRQDLTVRFKKAADGVYVEAKRSAIGGMTQVPLYFYGILLALGWNEIIAGKLAFYPMRIWKDIMLTCISPPEPRLLLPLICVCHWCIRDVSAQPLGPNHEDDRGGIQPGNAGG